MKLTCNFAGAVCPLFAFLFNLAVAQEAPLKGGVEDINKITPNLKDGDMVFVQSHTEQAGTLTILTGSHMTHCGILFWDPNQKKWVVYEGAGINEPKYKTLSDWKAHELHNPKNEPADLNIYVRRLKVEQPLTDTQVGKVKTAAAAMHATPYDKRFGWGDAKIYCSELLYKAYDKALGLQLADLSTYGKLLQDPQNVARLKSLEGPKGKEIRDYFLSDSLDKTEFVVSPGDLIRSDKLEVVWPVGQQPQ